MCYISELHKELPSALLSLLSVQQSPTLAALIPPCIQVSNIIKPVTKDVAPFTGALHMPMLQPFLQNNNTLTNSLVQPKEDQDSDAEYDDTDDIVLPEENDAFYDSGTNFSPNASNTNSNDAFDSKPDTKGHYLKRDGNSSDDASRQFECRHCGKKYRWKSTLRRHENVECGGKAPSHQCPYCSYKAKQRGNLGVHIRKHHNNEWYIYASNKVRRNKKTSI
ncbi:unnamed protein product [Parnassius mnemosyne]|uniref:C2H2-type domain-containing protein n=1 Tax=Parnassius mnemosyne TaxID=213953 RepID=A0AAV1KXI2_9NEOP